MGKSQSIRYTDVRRLMKIQAEQEAFDPLSPQWSEYLLPKLLQLVPAQLAFLAELNGFRPGAQPRSRGAAGVGWLDERSQRKFAEYVASKDVVSMNPVLAAAVPTSMRLFTRRRIELVEDNEWYRSKIVNTLFQVSKVDDNITSFLRIDDAGTTVGFGLFRAASDRPFDARDRRLVHLLLASVGPVHERAFRRSQHAQALPPRLRQVLDRLLAGDGEK